MWDSRAVAAGDAPPRFPLDEPMGTIPPTPVYVPDLSGGWIRTSTSDPRIISDPGAPLWPESCCPVDSGNGREILAVSHGEEQVHDHCPPQPRTATPQAPVNGVEQNGSDSVTEERPRLDVKPAEFYAGALERLMAQLRGQPVA